MQDPTVTLWGMAWKQRGRSEGTLSIMTSELERFGRWLQESYAMGYEAATMRHCLAYLVERGESSKHAAELAWRTLRSFYGFCTELDGTPSPMEKVKCPKRPEPSVKGITPAEYKQLLLVCGSDVRDKAIFALLQCTGLRRSELADLLLSDVNVEQRILIVRKSKTDKPRAVPMSTEAATYLLRYLRQRAKDKNASMPFLWLSRKGRLTSDGMRLLIERRAKQAGVKASAHMFRRSFAVDWLANGGSQVSLMSICGWSNPAMPARYTRHAAGQVAEAEYRRMFK